jgi:hypothetical protein
LDKNTLYILLFTLFFLFIYKIGEAQKIDTIYHINGNILTGDFKKLDFGVVTFKMDGMGTITIEEPKIKTFQSPKRFEIKLKGGLIYFGTIDTSGVNRAINIVTPDTTFRVFIDDIVEVFPIRKKFWMRTTGNFSLGLNFSKGSQVTTVSSSGKLDYRINKSYYVFDFDNNSTFQTDTLSASKADATISYQRALKKKWSNVSSFGATQNLELGTKLRLVLNDMIINDIVYNNWNRFYAGGGISLSTETSYDDSGSQQDIAALITVAWKVFKYSKPKVWVDSNINFLPYFTDSGRYRAVFNLNPKISIIKNDLKIGFQFYYNYDSKPPSEGASNTDYGINLQFTYSFH